MPVAIFQDAPARSAGGDGQHQHHEGHLAGFYDLQDKNLTMFSQYTAAPWEYIGTQGVIQGTFETLAAIAEQHFGGTLVGRAAAHRRDGRHGRKPDACDDDAGRRVPSAVDADERVIERRIERGFCDVVAPRWTRQSTLATRARPRASRWASRSVGNAAEVFPALLRRGNGALMS